LAAYANSELSLSAGVGASNSGFDIECPFYETAKDLPSRSTVICCSVRLLRTREVLPYFGTTFWFPPGEPGGGMIGIVGSEDGGGFFTPASPTGGGWITPVSLPPG
jgi:hypothetical protein